MSRCGILGCSRNRLAEASGTGRRLGEVGLGRPEAAVTAVDVPPLLRLDNVSKLAVELVPDALLDPADALLDRRIARLHDLPRLADVRHLGVVLFDPRQHGLLLGLQARLIDCLVLKRVQFLAQEHLGVSVDEVGLTSIQDLELHLV